MVGRITKTASELIRKEGSAALPAAVLVATHGVKEALRIFLREFAKERKKRKKS